MRACVCTGASASARSLPSSISSRVSAGAGECVRV